MSDRPPVPQHGPEVEGDVIVHRWGIGQWANDVLVRFSYELVEHEHRWPGQWLDDDFAIAARELRDVGPRLVRAVTAFEERVGSIEDALAGSVDEAVAAVLAATEAHDLVMTYLRRTSAATATVIPGAYGLDGRVLADRRWSIARLGDDLRMLYEVDPRLAGAIPFGRSLTDARAAPTTAPEFEPALAAYRSGATLRGRVLSSVRESVIHLQIAQRQVDALLPAMHRWLDGVLDCCIDAVAARAEDGEELAERWRERDWSVIARLASR